VGGYDIAKTAYHEVTNRTLGIKTLVTLAAIGAIVIGEYWEAAAVVFLFSLGSYLEGRTMRKTRTALQELLEMTPDTATVRRDGELREVPARDVEESEVVVVKPGGKIPVDGTVVDGESAVNQAPVTGESAPVHKADGDEVYAGTVNQEGALQIRTAGAGSDTTLERIIRRVEEAQEAQSPTESLIDRFAKYYTGRHRARYRGVRSHAERNPLTDLVGHRLSQGARYRAAGQYRLRDRERRSVWRADEGRRTPRTRRQDRPRRLRQDRHPHERRNSRRRRRGVRRRRRRVLSLAATAEKKSEHHLADAIVDAARGRLTAATDGGATVGNTVNADRDDRSIPDPDDFDVVAGKESSPT